MRIWIGAVGCWTADLFDQPRRLPLSVRNDVRVRACVVCSCRVPGAPIAIDPGLAERLWVASNAAFRLVTE